MDVQQFEDRGLHLGTRVLIELASRVIRAGIFLGTGDSPVDPKRHGVLFAIEPEQRVVEWVDLAYVQDISATIPVDA